MEALKQLLLVDVYVSFEFETHAEDYETEDVEEELKSELGEKGFNRYIYTLYDDGSCGTEIVTKPFKYPLTSDDLDAIKKIVKVAWMYTDFDRYETVSTHTTFTVSPKREEAVPEGLRKISIYNAKNYYLGIIATLTAYAGLRFRYSRKTEFRYHYVSDELYCNDKHNYPAVFVPNYLYNGLPKYHKIEWRIPDAYQILLDNGLSLNETAERIRKIVDFLYMLTTRRISSKGDNMLYLAMNRYFAGVFYDEPIEFDFENYEGKYLKKVLYMQLRDMERSGHLRVLGLTPKSVISTIGHGSLMSFPTDYYEPIKVDEIAYFLSVLRR